MSHANGYLAAPPIALAEAQGYLYAALAGRGGRRRDPRPHGERRTLRREAQQLRERFERDFWMPDQGCYAQALDGDKQRCAR